MTKLYNSLVFWYNSKKNCISKSNQKNKFNDNRVANNFLFFCNFIGYELYYHSFTVI